MKIWKEAYKKVSITWKCKIRKRSDFPRVLHGPPLHCNILSYFSGFKFLPQIYIAVRQRTSIWLQLQKFVQQTALSF